MALSKNMPMTLEMYIYSMMRMAGGSGTLSYQYLLSSLIWRELSWTVVHFHELLNCGKR